jgi:hypothetical protein
MFADSVELRRSQEDSMFLGVVQQPSQASYRTEPRVILLAVDLSFVFTSRDTTGRPGGGANSQRS